MNPSAGVRVNPEIKTLAYLYISIIYREREISGCSLPCCLQINETCEVKTLARLSIYIYYLYMYIYYVYIYTYIYIYMYICIYIERGRSRVDRCHVAFRSTRLARSRRWRRPWLRRSCASAGRRMATCRRPNTKRPPRRPTRCRFVVGSLAYVGNPPIEENNPESRFFLAHFMNACT